MDPIDPMDSMDGDTRPSCSLDDDTFDVSNRTIDHATTEGNGPLSFRHGLLKGRYQLTRVFYFFWCWRVDRIHRLNLVRVNTRFAFVAKLFALASFTKKAFSIRNVKK